MANITGKQTVGDTLVISVDADPSSGLGTNASIGTYASVNNGGGIYFKANASLTGWIKLPSTSMYGKVRCIYLVQDASDALAMGAGNLQNNYYTTFQSAYNAADALQVSLGAANIVVIIVGNITSAAAGNLTLTANYNTNVHIMGLSPSNSVLGNIVATNGAGNGYNVGSVAAPMKIYNVRLGNISTNATGAVGNSGSVGLQGIDFFTGAITTAITNAANTTGNGGNVSYNNSTVSAGPCTIGAITTSSMDPATSAGTVSLVGNVICGNITTCNDNLGGAINITGIPGKANITSIFFHSTDASLNAVVTVNNATIGIVDIQAGASVGGNGHNFLNSEINVSHSVLSNGIATPQKVTYINCNCTVVYITDPDTITIAKRCSIFGIIALGNDSVLSLCDLDNGAGVDPVINEIGTGVGIYMCSILNGTFGIFASASVSVAGLSSFIQNGVNPNVTLT